MVSEGWERTEIGKVCSAIVDCVNKTAPVVEHTTPYRMIRTTNVRHGRVDTQNVRYVTEETFDTWTRRGKLQDEDIILTREAPVGEVGLLQNATGMFLGQRTMVYRADPSQMDQRFLFQTMISSSMLRQYNVLSAGGTVAHIRVPDCSKFILNVPPLTEQQKIACILSTWDRAIEAVERLIANSKAQKKALMQQLLTGKRRFPGFEGAWREVRLADVATVNPKRFGPPEDGRITFLPMEAVSDEAQILRRDGGDYEAYSKGYTTFQEGDVLIAKITPCFENGKGCFAEGLENGVGFGSTEFHVLRAHRDTSSRFLYHLTNSREFRFRGEANMQGSAGQRRVPTDFLKTYRLSIPPTLGEQEKVTVVLDRLDGAIAVQRSRLQAIRDEKKALMQQLLTGKRRVTVNEEAA